eukprot:m.64631 g.64631  ORF g.64631 m.64631 type:complete len:448 (-) comp16441_c0_seq1:3093-4436(-)
MTLFLLFLKGWDSVQGSAQKGGDFPLVGVLVAGCCCGTWSTASVSGTLAGVMLRLAERGLQARPHVGPGAHVLGFFLAPGDFGIREVIGKLVDQVKREGRDLLDAAKHDILHFLLAARLGQLVVHLAGAEHDALDVGVLAAFAGPQAAVSFAQHALKRRLSRHLRQRGRGLLQPQQALGRRNYQRLAEVAVQLAAQDVKVVGGGGAVGHLPVGVLDLQLSGGVMQQGLGIVLLVVAAQLQEAFQAAGRVLRTHALVAVRQQHHQAGLRAPLDLARRQEVVNDDAGAVGKVAKLRFPQHKLVGRLQAVAQLKAQHCKLGQVAVTDCILRLTFSQGCQRRVAPHVHLLIVQHVMPLAEGATLHVLPTQPHVYLFPQQTAKCQHLRRGPVDAFAFQDTVLSPRKNALESAEHSKVAGVLAALHRNFLEDVLADASVGGQVVTRPVLPSQR